MKKTLTIGMNIRQQLGKEQLTQTELAKRMHCSASTIHRYIYGDVVPNIIVLSKLAAALNCTTDELLAEREKITIEQTDESIKNFFKANVEYYLLKNGMLKGDLAAKLNVTPMTITRGIKYGYNKEKIVYMFAKALNCSYEDLLEEKEERSKEKMSSKVPDNLLRLISKKNITIEELAKKSGLKVNTVSSYIMKYRFPNARAFTLIAEALECEIEELLK